MAKTIYAPAARDDLQDIVEFVGERRPEFLSGECRSFSFGNYVIFFRPVPRGIEVVRVVRGDRDVRSLWFDKGITMTAGKTYTVSDGEMLLILETAEEGGYVVTSPLDPELITEAESLDEAFQNARDAARVLNESRQKLAKQLAEAARAS
jgi:antitoxin HicB